MTWIRSLFHFCNLYFLVLSISFYFNSCLASILLIFFPVKSHWKVSFQSCLGILFFKVFHVLGKITLNCHEKFNTKKFETLVLIQPVFTSKMCEPLIKPHQIFCCYNELLSCFPDWNKVSTWMNLLFSLFFGLVSQIIHYSTFRWFFQLSVIFIL